MTPPILKLDVYNILSRSEDSIAVDVEPTVTVTRFEDSFKTSYHPGRHRIEGTAESILREYVEGLALVLAVAEVDGLLPVDDELGKKIVERSTNLKTILRELL